MKPDKLGDKCKMFEMAKAGEKAMQGLPLLARLDGRAFHTYTAGLRRPYDPRMQDCMIGTVQALITEFNASIGYTQSDEITLLWPGDAEVPFDGRYQKLCSVLASLASVSFSRLAHEWLPEKRHLTPLFDCRVWQVPRQEEAMEVFVWREDDAVKNSVQMAAQSFYTSKELHGKDRAAQMDMLMEKGQNWNDYPAAFKRGTYVRRTYVERTLTPDELANIPEAFRPKGPVLRGVVSAIEAPPIRRIGNVLEFLFEGANPIPRAEAVKVQS